MPVSLRLPPKLKTRVTALAAHRDQTPHAFMLEAIREKLEAEEQREAFLAEAERRLKEVNVSRKAIPAQEVFDYLNARARGQKSARPKPHKIS